MYEKGLGVIRSFQMAFKWYLQAANKGLAISQCSVGRFYEYGNGFQIDTTSALKWYQKSANQGHSDGQKAVYRLNRSGFFMTNKESKQKFIFDIYNLINVYIRISAF
jgi:TPR repeat protein